MWISPYFKARPVHIFKPKTTHISFWTSPNFDGESVRILKKKIRDVKLAHIFKPKPIHNFKPKIARLLFSLRPKSPLHISPDFREKIRTGFAWNPKVLSFQESRSCWRIGSKCTSHIHIYIHSLLGAGYKTCYGCSTCKIWLKMNNKRLLNIMLRQLQKLLFLLVNIGLILTLPWKGLQLKIFFNQ